MVPSLSKFEMEKTISDKYKYFEKRIVGIMLARYDISLIREVIEESYYYWHKNSSDRFDLFWPGYGEYFGNGATSNTIIEARWNNNGIYFDLDSFIEFKNSLNRIKGFKYKDKFELILVNYYNGELHYDEYLRIDLEKNIDDNYSTIRSLLETITNDCYLYSNVSEFHKKLIRDDIVGKIKGITLSDVIYVAINKLT